MVFNIHLDKDHTYFVTKIGIVVHNYVVTAKDRMEGVKALAARYNTSVADLVRLNPSLANGRALKPGEILFLPNEELTLASQKEKNLAIGVIAVQDLIRQEEAKQRSLCASIRARGSFGCAMTREYKERVAKIARLKGVAGQLEASRQIAQEEFHREYGKQNWEAMKHKPRDEGPQLRQDNRSEAEIARANRQAEFDASPQGKATAVHRANSGWKAVYTESSGVNQGAVDQTNMATAVVAGEILQNATGARVVKGLKGMALNIVKTTRHADDPRVRRIIQEGVARTELNPDGTLSIRVAGQRNGENVTITFDKDGNMGVSINDKPGFHGQEASISAEVNVFDGSSKIEAGRNEGGGMKVEFDEDGVTTSATMQSQAADSKVEVGSSWTWDGFWNGASATIERSFGEGSAEYNHSEGTIEVEAELKDEDGYTRYSTENEARIDNEPAPTNSGGTGPQSLQMNPSPGNEGGSIPVNAPASTPGAPGAPATTSAASLAGSLLSGLFGSTEPATIETESQPTTQRPSDLQESIRQGPSRVRNIFAGAGTELAKAPGELLDGALTLAGTAFSTVTWPVAAAGKFAFDVVSPVNSVIGEIASGFARHGSYDYDDLSDQEKESVIRNTLADDFKLPPGEISDSMIAYRMAANETLASRVMRNLNFGFFDDPASAEAERMLDHKDKMGREFDRIRAQVDQYPDQPERGAAMVTRDQYGYIQVFDQKDIADNPQLRERFFKNRPRVLIHGANSGEAGENAFDLDSAANYGDTISIFRNGDVSVQDQARAINAQLQRINDIRSGAYYEGSGKQVVDYGTHPPAGEAGFNIAAHSMANPALLHLLAGAPDVENNVFRQPDGSFTYTKDAGNLNIIGVAPATGSNVANVMNSSGAGFFRGAMGSVDKIATRQLQEQSYDFLAGKDPHGIPDDATRENYRLAREQFSSIMVGTKSGGYGPFGLDKWDGGPVSWLADPMFGWNDNDILIEQAQVEKIWDIDNGPYIVPTNTNHQNQLDNSALMNSTRTDGRTGPYNFIENDWSAPLASRDALELPCQRDNCWGPAATVPDVLPSFNIPASPFAVNNRSVRDYAPTFPTLPPGHTIQPVPDRTNTGADQ